MPLGDAEMESSPSSTSFTDGKPVLLDGYDERHLHLEVLRWLINPEVAHIDLAVSFIMKSGVNLITGHLETALQRGARVRIITTAG